MIAADELSKVVTAQNVEKLRDYLASEFGLDKDSEFEGIYPLILALWGSGIPQGVYQFFKDMHILEKQVMNYLGQLGADVKTAETDVALSTYNWYERFKL